MAETTILLAVRVQHGGQLTGEEIAGTMGAWVQALPEQYRLIETTTGDDVPASFRILEARASVDVGPIAPK